MEIKNERITFRWQKYRYGFANVTMKIMLSGNGKNTIIENYAGTGWTGQGHINSIPSNGFEGLKAGAIKVWNMQHHFQIRTGILKLSKLSVFLLQIQTLL